MSILNKYYDKDKKISCVFCEDLNRLNINGSDAKRGYFRDIGYVIDVGEFLDPLENEISELKTDMCKLKEQNERLVNIIDTLINEISAVKS